MEEMLIEAEVVTVLDRLTYGEICPLETILHYRQQMAVYEQLKKSLLFLDAVEQALRQYGRQKHGSIALIYKRTYNYAACGDATLEVLEAMQKEADAQVKARRDFLRSLTESVYDMEGCEIKPPTSKSNRIIEVSQIKSKSKWQH
jgi:hypothetical protein